jgi:hypothetical protein
MVDRNGNVRCDSLECIRTVWFNPIGVPRSIYGGIRISFTGTFLSMLTLIAHMNSYKYGARILTFALQTSNLTLTSPQYKTPTTGVCVSLTLPPRTTRAMASHFSEAEKPLDSSANSHTDIKKRPAGSPAHSEKVLHAHSFESLDPDALEAERRNVLRKMDWKLLPFVSFLYLLSFL